MVALWLFVCIKKEKSQKNMRDALVFKSKTPPPMTNQ